MKEDWPVLVSFFPDNWIELAHNSNALKGLRKDKEVENYIRILLIHIACGYSMRETVTRAKLSGLGDMSDVAFLGRLRKAKDWLHHLCVALFEEQGISLRSESVLPIRLFDATNVKEPGKTGSLWRIHYSLQLPSLTCDFFKLTATKGKGTGESFFQYSIKKGDYIIADRGYSTASGIHHVASKQAFVMVRVNTQTLPLVDVTGQPFSLLENVRTIRSTGNIKTWKVLVPNKKNQYVQGRICVIRKSNEAIKLAQDKIIREARKKQRSVKPETLTFAKYIIVFSNYPEECFSDHELLEWYRSRWQVELVFKRFKSIAHIGHLPKYSDDSSKAWLYGKLFVALLTTKLIAYASSISPWGYFLERQSNSKCMARI